MMNMGCAIKCIPCFVCVLSMSAVVGGSSGFVVNCKTGRSGL